MEIVLGPFSERLKLLRKEKKVKQRDMAALLDCTERHYQKIEYGQINVPALTLVTLADYFQVSTDYILGRTDER